MPSKKFCFNSNYNLRKHQINEDVRNGKNVVIICLSKTTLDDLYEEIKKDNKDCKILRYSSMTDDEQKTKLKDVNNYWKEYNVLLYTPSIEAGISFELEIAHNKVNFLKT